MSVDIATLAIRIDSLEAREARRDLDQLRDAGDRTERSTNSLTSATRGLMSALQVLALAKLAQEFVQAADAISLMDARLKLATTSALEFAQAQRDVYKIAQENSLGLIEAATLYTKLAEPIRNLGGGARETAAIVDAFATTLRISGAATQEAAAATMQFAQAMGSGKLSGDEFRSMAETSPRFMKAMAEGMGVPIGKLKEMAGEGRLTADVVGNALTSSLAVLKAEAATIPDTVGGAFTRMKNDILTAVGEINKNSGSTLGLVDMIDEARKLIPAVRDELIEAFQSVNTLIDSNRAGLGEMWDVTKSLVGDVWAIAKGAASVVGFLIEWGTQSGTFKTVLETVRLLLAGIQDGVKIIGAAFAGVGADIIEYLTMPIRGLMLLIGTMADAVGLDFGQGLIDAANKITDISDKARGYADGIVKDFMEGRTAVAAVAAEIEKSNSTAIKAKSDLNAGWLQADIEYVERVKVVMAAYAGYSLEVQRAAMKSLAEGTYGFTTLKAPKTGLDDKELKAANQELAKQKKLLADLSGVNADYMEQLTRLQVVRDSLNMSEERYVELDSLN